jgi:hypothetical protein
MGRLATKTPVMVSDIGAEVELQIGSQSMRLSYENALQLSAWLRLHAKNAKRFAGDTSRRWHAIADISNIQDQ